jgi:uncharacterized protein
MEPITTTTAMATLLLQRLAGGDSDSIAALFADHIDWLVPGNPALPWVGARTERSEVADYFRTMWPNFEPGKSSSDLESVVVDGEHAVIFAMFTHTAATTGRSFRTPVALHIVVRDGAIAKLHLYEDTWAVSAAFISDGAPVSK